MKQAIKLTIIVLTYNRSDALLKVLQSLSMQCHSAHEIVVADDGSTAACVSTWVNTLPKFACQVKHVWHPDTGFTASRARNMGAQASQGSYLVFLDGDCIPGKHFVQAHEAIAATGCFVNGNRVMLSEQLTHNVLHQEADLLKASAADWLQWRVWGDVNKLAQLVYWPGAPFRRQKHFQWKKIRSCNFALWKSDFVNVNGFDESFAGWGHEDADLVLRLHNAGLVRQNGYFGTEVYHLWHPQFSRQHEELNYQRVLQRMQTSITQAAKGLRQVLANDAHVLTTLN